KNFYRLNLFSSYSTHSIILRNIGDNKVILDVGCNDGYIGKNSDKSNIFYGLDYLDESIQNAKIIYKDAIFYDLNILENLPWNIKFDVIIFADVLEHVLYPEVVLNFFIKNYLKDGGKIIISLPNIANWQVRINLLFGKFDYADSGIMDKTHLHLYTFKSATNFAQKSNLKIINILGGASFFGIVLRFIPFLNSLLTTNIIIVAVK
ncbi:class I SAM-dependent methyltransferase, partial [Patescibacteria group bacterium]|nr:class I SAM-dependent methyltransferase [Patescibacteria group bacterium]